MSDGLRERVARALWDLDRPEGSHVPVVDFMVDAVLAELAPELAVAAAIRECMDRGWTIEFIPGKGGVRVVVGSGFDFVGWPSAELTFALPEAMDKARARWGEG